MSTSTLCSGICYRKSICLSSVTFVHPSQPVETFGNVFILHFYLNHLLTSMQHITEIVPGIEHFRRGSNARGLSESSRSKYSDVGHVEGYIYIYISETVKDTALGTIIND